MGGELRRSEMGREGAGAVEFGRGGEVGVGVDWREGGVRRRCGREVEGGRETPGGGREERGSVSDGVSGPEGGEVVGWGWEGGGGGGGGLGREEERKSNSRHALKGREKEWRDATHGRPEHLLLLRDAQLGQPRLDPLLLHDLPEPLAWEVDVEREELPGGSLFGRDLARDHLWLERLLFSCDVVSVEGEGDARPELKRLVLIVSLSGVRELDDDCLLLFGRRRGRGRGVEGRSAGRKFGRGRRSCFGC